MNDEKSKIVDIENYTIILFVINILNELKGPILGRTYLQKLFFLINDDIERKDKEFRNAKPSVFNFVNHFYGPFSRELNIVLSKLSFDSYINETKSGELYVYVVSNKGKVFLDKNKGILNNKLRVSITSIVNYFKDFSATELLNFVYRRFPSSTTKSIIPFTREKNFLNQNDF